jgi:hypothetical protein
VVLFGVIGLVLGQVRLLIIIKSIIMGIKLIKNNKTEIKLSLLNTNHRTTEHLPKAKQNL